MRRPTKEVTPPSSDNSNQPAATKVRRKSFPSPPSYSSAAVTSLASDDDDESFDPWTFDFKSPRLNMELAQWFRDTKLPRSTLTGMLVYNLIALPAFIYRDVYQKSDLLVGKFGTIGQVFLSSVLLVHVLFFLFYYYETLDERRPTMTPTERATNAAHRMAVVNMYIVVGPLACGLVMNCETAFKYCFPSFVDGMVPVEPLLIGTFLSVYHHHLFPVQWRVVVVAWACLLLLIVLSWAPTASSQYLVSNLVLTGCFAASVALNHRVHATKVAMFLSDLSGHRRSEARRRKSFRLRKDQEAVGEYLAENYRPRDGGDGDDGGDSVKSRTDVSALTTSSSSTEERRVRAGESPPMKVAQKRTFLAKERPLF